MPIMGVEFCQGGLYELASLPGFENVEGVSDQTDWLRHFFERLVATRPLASLVVVMDMPQRL